MLPIQVHVEGDTTTAVTIELPITPITLVVTSPDCDHIALQSPAGPYLDFENCKAGVAQFVDVSPGTYIVCRQYDQCNPVTVAKSPTHQELAFQIPTPDPPTPEPPTSEPPTSEQDPPTEEPPAPDPDGAAETPAP